MTKQKRAKAKKGYQPSHPEMENALYLWVVQQRTKHTPLTSIVIREKAEAFHKKVCKVEKCDFKASYGWFSRFKDRFSLKVKRIHGEKLSADLSRLDSFKIQLQNLIIANELSLDEIYNADESAMYYKVLPNRTLALVTEKKISGAKAQRDRFTFMPCSNVNGTHKLNLQIIGKARNPRCFNKRVPPETDYFSSKNAWQTKYIFNKWFHDSFVPSVRKYAKENNKSHAKALLLLDNCSAHNELDLLRSDDGLITALFLPPNVTSEVQPMDQNVIVCVKNHYRKMFLQYILTHDNLLQAVKQFTLFKAITYITNAWKNVQRSTIFKSWSKLLGDLDIYKNHVLVESNTEKIDLPMLTDLANKINVKNNINELINEKEVSEWISESDDVSSHKEYDDNEIINYVTGNTKDIDLLENELNEADMEPYDSQEISAIHEFDYNQNNCQNTPNHSDILNHLDALLELIDENEVEKLITLREWRQQYLNDAN